MKITRQEEAPVRYVNRNLCATVELQITPGGIAHYFVPKTFEYLGKIIRGTRGNGYIAYFVYNENDVQIAEVGVNIGPALDYFAKAEV